jgi:nucleoside-diphosphate-sugar epimerase
LARILIVGCGCRGTALGRALIDAGHAVRGTSRSDDAVERLQSAGIEPFIGDPDRVATLTPALEHVVVACILLGSARGPGEAVSALHGTRLEMLLTKIIDTTVRGVVYESKGSVDAAVLASGAARVQAACEDSMIPFALLDEEMSDRPAWTAAALAAVESVLVG